MPKRLSSVLLLAIALTTSCSASMKKPDIKNNPHPTQRYELTVTVKGAPGPFDKVVGNVLYQVHNPDCVPHAPVTGAADIPNTVLQIDLARVDDHTWKGYFFRDQLQDENYFGLGVCHWQVMSAGPHLQVHGMSLNPAPDLWNEPAEQSVTKYFSIGEFSNRSLEGSAMQWRATDEKVVQQPDAYFPVTVSVKESTK